MSALEQEVKNNATLWTLLNGTSNEIELWIRDLENKELTEQDVRDTSVRMRAQLAYIRATMRSV